MPKNTFQFKILFIYKYYAENISKYLFLTSKILIHKFNNKNYYYINKFFKKYYSELKNIFSNLFECILSTEWNAVCVKFYLFRNFDSCYCKHWNVWKLISVLSSLPFLSLTLSRSLSLPLGIEFRIVPRRYILPTRLFPRYLTLLQLQTGAQEFWRKTYPLPWWEILPLFTKIFGSRINTYFWSLQLWELAELFIFLFAQLR